MIGLVSFLGCNEPTKNKLTKVNIDILEPERIDLTQKDVIGKILQYKHGKAYPLSFRCFELDTKIIKNLIESCVLFDEKKWEFVFIENEAYQTLLERNLISTWAGFPALQLGIGATISGRKYITRH